MQNDKHVLTYEKSAALGRMAGLAMDINANGKHKADFHIDDDNVATFTLSDQAGIHPILRCVFHEAPNYPAAMEFFSFIRVVDEGLKFDKDGDENKDEITTKAEAKQQLEHLRALVKGNPVREAQVKALEKLLGMVPDDSEPAAVDGCGEEDMCGPDTQAEGGEA